MSYIYWALSITVGLFISAYLFNHLNAWIGIGLGVALVIGNIHILISHINKISNEK